MRITPLVEGVVTEENKGGIVVSVKGVRVFVPASQTGLPRDAAMSELLKQHVRLRITEVNRARRRVVGSIRAVTAEERAAKAAEVWENIEEGKKYTGTVKSLTSYGAFVDIGGVDGMVHISELSWSRIKHPSEVVKVGDTVEVYVISFDKEKKKISLGMKDRSQDPWTVFTTKYSVGDTANVKVVKLMTFALCRDRPRRGRPDPHLPDRRSPHREARRCAQRGPDGGREDHRHRHGPQEGLPVHPRSAGGRRGSRGGRYRRGVILHRQAAKRPVSERKQAAFFAIFTV